MFVLEDDKVLLTRDRSVLCHIDELSQVFYALSELQRLHMDEISGEELFEDRLSHEGIDLNFTAEPDFKPDLELWRQDAPQSWRNRSGPELFQLYQAHAEYYCSGCSDQGVVPSYEGFRQYLIRIRDYTIDEDLVGDEDDE